MSCVIKAETEKKLHQVRESWVESYPMQVDPSYEVPKEAATVDGIWIYPWGGLVMLGYAFGAVLCFLIGHHAKRILKAQRSRSLHQEVFRSLVLQVSRN